MPGSSESGAVPNSSVTDPPVFVLLPQPPATTASARTPPRITTKRSFLIADLSSFPVRIPPCAISMTPALHPSLTRRYLASPARQDSGGRRRRFSLRQPRRGSLMPAVGCPVASQVGVARGVVRDNR